MDDEKSQTDQEESGNDLPPKNVSVADSDKEKEIGSNKDDQGASGDHERWPHRVIAIFSTLLVLITGFYTFYARQQIDLTREGRGGPHPLDRFSSQLRWNPVHDSSDLGLTGTGA